MMYINTYSNSVRSQLNSLGLVFLLCTGIVAVHRFHVRMTKTMHPSATFWQATCTAKVYWNASKSDSIWGSHPTDLQYNSTTYSSANVLMLCGAKFLRSVILALPLFARHGTVENRCTPYLCSQPAILFWINLDKLCTSRRQCNSSPTNFLIFSTSVICNTLHT